MHGQVGQEADSLEEALSMLEQQQATLRAQRHDFMNHIQVVYCPNEKQAHRAARIKAAAMAELGLRGSLCGDVRLE